MCVPCCHQVNAIVEEYFSSGDVNNAADSLSEQEAPVATMGHYFVKRLLTLALDRKDKEREMASNLLSNLYSEVWVLTDRHRALKLCNLHSVDRRLLSAHSADTGLCSSPAHTGLAWTSGRVGGAGAIC